MNDSLSTLIKTPRQHAGRPRCPKLQLLAIEYLMWPGKRPHGLLKELAYSNGTCPQNISYVIRRLKEAVK